MPWNEQWLGQIKEAIIEPDLPIIDPHHHLWDYSSWRYLLDELDADTGSGHNIQATVFVECNGMYRVDGPEQLKPVGETEFANGIAEQSVRAHLDGGGACQGIVSFADLTLGDAVDEVLEAHVRAAPERFRGIRYITACDDSEAVRASYTNPPKGLMGTRQFREGFGRLSAYGLSFDAWLYHHQIPELTSLARAFPESTIILDHFGGPLGVGPYEGQFNEIFAKWSDDIVELSTCENVVVKLGGIHMERNGFGWHRRELPPTSDELVAATKHYYLHTINAFGPKRCMFESNFPVDKVSCAYPVLWNAFKKIAQGFNAEEKAALFHDTAANTYRLD
jgi:predicted TIM-barrel fold metal-dependent hydrolase